MHKWKEPPDDQEVLDLYLKEVEFIRDLGRAVVRVAVVLKLPTRRVRDALRRKGVEVKW